nr:PREDICTED: GDNF family receptor alpha-2-like [Apteryx mantelli mantelli]
MLANKECQAALEVLQGSPLYDCRCKRAMKKELQCLQIYWSIHLGLTEGEEFYEASPYEPVTSRLSDIFRLASIFSALAWPRRRGRPGPGKPRSVSFHFFFKLCSFPLPGFLRFGEGGEQTLPPQLGPLSLLFPGPRSRLADFHSNCQASPQAQTGCPGDNYQACLGSYAGLIGFDVTPNYVDASTAGITVSPWCSCKGSGNLEEECEKFLRDFTENPCLRNAIQAFGNGTDVSPSSRLADFHSNCQASPQAQTGCPGDNYQACLGSYAGLIGNAIQAFGNGTDEHGPKLNKSKEQSLCYSEQSSSRLRAYRAAGFASRGARASLSRCNLLSSGGSAWGQRPDKL